MPGAILRAGGGVLLTHGGAWQRRRDAGCVCCDKIIVTAGCEPMHLVTNYESICGSGYTENSPEAGFRSTDGFIGANVQLGIPQNFGGLLLDLSESVKPTTIVGVARFPIVGMGWESDTFIVGSTCLQDCAHPAVGLTYPVWDNTLVQGTFEVRLTRTVASWPANLYTALKGSQTTCRVSHELNIAETFPLQFLGLASTASVTYTPVDKALPWIENGVWWTVRNGPWSYTGHGIQPPPLVCGGNYAASSGTRTGMQEYVVRITAG